MLRHARLGRARQPGCDLVRNRPANRSGRTERSPTSEPQLAPLASTSSTPSPLYLFLLAFLSRTTDATAPTAAFPFFSFLSLFLFLHHPLRFFLSSCSSLPLSLAHAVAVTTHFQHSTHLPAISFLSLFFCCLSFVRFFSPRAMCSSQ